MTSSLGKPKHFQIDRLSAFRYKAIDFYRVLIAEIKGLPVQTYDESRSRNDMRDILRKNFGTDDIEEVSYDKLKAII